MTEETTNLVLEHLRAIRRDMARMADDMNGLKTEMSAMRHQMAAVITLQDRDHSDIADLKHRIDRIERRLDLVD